MSNQDFTLIQRKNELKANFVGFSLAFSIFLLLLSFIYVSLVLFASSAVVFLFSSLKLKEYLVSKKEENNIVDSNDFNE